MKASILALVATLAIVQGAPLAISDVVAGETTAAAAANPIELNQLLDAPSQATPTINDDEKQLGDKFADDLSDPPKDKKDEENHHKNHKDKEDHKHSHHKDKEHHQDSDKDQDDDPVPVLTANPSDNDKDKNKHDKHDHHDKDKHDHDDGKKDHGKGGNGDNNPDPLVNPQPASPKIPVIVPKPIPVPQHPNSDPHHPGPYDPNYPGGGDGGGYGNNEFPRSVSPDGGDYGRGGGYSPEYDPHEPLVAPIPGVPPGSNHDGYQSNGGRVGDGHGNRDGYGRHDNGDQYGHIIHDGGQGNKNKPIYTNTTNGGHATDYDSDGRSEDCHYENKCPCINYCPPVGAKNETYAPPAKQQPPAYVHGCDEGYPTDYPSNGEPGSDSDSEWYCEKRKKPQLPPAPVAPPPAVTTIPCEENNYTTPAPSPPIQPPYQTPEQPHYQQPAPPPPAPAPIPCPHQATGGDYGGEKPPCSSPAAPLIVVPQPEQPPYQAPPAPPALPAPEEAPYPASPAPPAPPAPEQASYPASPAPSAPPSPEQPPHQAPPDLAPAPEHPNHGGYVPGLPDYEFDKPKDEGDNYQPLAPPPPVSPPEEPPAAGPGGPGKGAQPPPFAISGGANTKGDTTRMLVVGAVSVAVAVLGGVI